MLFQDNKGGEGGEGGGGGRCIGRRAGLGGGELGRGIGGLKEEGGGGARRQEFRMAKRDMKSVRQESERELKKRG